MNRNQKGMRVDSGSASEKNTQTTKSKKTIKNPISKKNLLIYAHYYGDVASTAQILQELAEGMLDALHATDKSFVEVKQQLNVA